MESNNYFGKISINYRDISEFDLTKMSWAKKAFI